MHLLGIQTMREESKPCNTSKLLLAISLPNLYSMYILPSGSATNFTTSFISIHAIEDIVACLVKNSLLDPISVMNLIKKYELTSIMKIEGIKQ